jgi:hypothetical protein
VGIDYFMKFINELITLALSRPALIQSTETMKCLLDSMLVLTKQDRLCHVIHATSDPFYQTWLRQLNIMQHCKVRSGTLINPHSSIPFL